MAGGIRSGRDRSNASWSGCSSSAAQPLAMRLAVVSKPAKNEKTALWPMSPAGDALGGGLQACEEREHGVVDDLLRGEAVIALLRGEQHGQQVAARLAAA